MKLDYIYHSGFALEAEGVTVIIDYYKDSSETSHNHGIVHDELLKRPGKLYVLATHYHPDHFNPEVLKWREQRPDIIYVFSSDILEQKRATKDDAFYLSKGEKYENETLSIDTFGSTDVGSSFLIHLQGMRIFHAGDLNNWHWCEESTKEYVEQANHDFLTEVDDLKKVAPALDVAMFPVDGRMGREYMKGAKQFIEQIKTTIFVPMHFSENYAGANAFAPIAEAAGCRFIAIEQRGERFDITLNNK